MADVHVTTAGVVFHNPAVHPLPVSAGKAPSPSVKSAGQPNGVVHGQATGTTVILDNPA